MISPEILRKYPFFAFLSPKHLNQLAMIADELPINQGDCLFDTGDMADALYILLSGSIELATESYDVYYKPELRRSYLVGEVNPGEPFGLSAVIPPYRMSASALATSDSQVLRIEAVDLRDYMAENSDFAAGLYQKMNEALMERLNYTRIQLAAARA